MNEDDPLFENDDALLGMGEDGDADPWSDSIGSDTELDALWSRLLTAIGDTPPAELPPRIATHFARLGARSRRTTEGLILALAAATATSGGWADWRVVLHRHFVRDERMEVAVAAAILAEWQKDSIPPDWHAEPEGVPERVLRSYGADMEAALRHLSSGDATEAAVDLGQYASEAFDFISALPPESAEALRDSPQAAAMLTGLRQQITDAEAGQPRAVAQPLAQAAALLEVSARALAIPGPARH